MKVIGVQLDIAWEDAAANHARARRLVETARPEPGDLVVLPEMFATGFSMRARRIAEAPGGPTAQFLGDLARRHRVHIVAGVAVQGPSGARARNEAVWIAPDGACAGRYVKRHPFSISGEDRHYEAGDDLLILDWGGFPACPFICYDLRFPEDFRRAARRGAELFVVIANWPSARAHHWRALLMARAIENQAYVAGVNRCGRDPKNEYAGGSLIVDPQGNIVAEAGGDETVIQATPDRAALLEYRRRFPVLADMRDDE